MIHLLNLLASIALLVWGTQLVRTGILRVFGENLRQVLAHSMGSRPRAVAAGLVVTSLIQSSTATCLIVASFLGRNLVPLAAALAVILGADVGSSMMAVVFSFDLSWLSPLLIFVGVVNVISREKSTAGRLGRVAIGLGLILMSLRLIMESTQPLLEAPAVRALLASLPNEVMLEIVVGAALTVLSYSSLAIVLLTAALAASGLCRHDGAGPGPGRQRRQRGPRRAVDGQEPDPGAATSDRQPGLQARRRRHRDSAAGAGPVAAPEDPEPAPAGGAVPSGLQHRDGGAVPRPDGVPRRSNWTAGSRRLRSGGSSARSTSMRRRWRPRRWRSAAPRARHCTRPTSSRRCCAASCR